MSEEEYFIPIDEEINRFKNHLDGNERVIFSAKFGDGKTFFLDIFFDPDTNEEYHAIKLYPVNYQVEDNKDVFELIKRDILIQLLGSGLVDSENIIDDYLFTMNYIWNKGTNIALDLLTYIPILKTPTKAVQQALKHLEAFNKDKAETTKTDSQKVTEFINTFSNKAGIYEYDVYSELITKCIKNIKEKGKKVVILIEDLDRIDPAHLFRILNIFTAHIDRQCTVSDKSKSTPQNNKFNFDKIIMVCHYENIKNIYCHFYGNDAGFDGYIHKFTTSKPFTYSLSKLYIEHIIKLVADKDISEYMWIYKPIIESSISEKKHSLRKLKDNFTRPFHENKVDVITSTSGKFLFLSPFSKCLIICKRLDIDLNKIIDIVSENIEDSVLNSFIGAHWFYLSPAGEYRSESNSKVVSFSYYCYGMQQCETIVEIWGIDANKYKWHIKSFIREMIPMISKHINIQ